MSSAQAAPVLQVRNLSAVIATGGGAVRRIQDWSYDFHPGQLYTMIGPSGLGKTSLCLTLIGWPRPNVEVVGGEVIFADQSIHALPLDKRARLWGRSIAYVPQSTATALNPARRVVGQIAEQADGDDAAGRVARMGSLRAAFGALGIPGFDEKRYPHQYSGGQIQRILLSTLFATEPRLIVVDEPTTALHPSMKADVIKAMKARGQQLGAATIVVSHELAYFEGLSDVTIDLAAHLSEPEGRRAAGGSWFGWRRPKSPSPSPARRNEPRAGTFDLLRFLDPSRATGISVRGLTIRARRGGRALVSDVSFEVAPGTCHAIVGPSGAGKTTILRGMLGQHRHAAGEIIVGAASQPLFYRKRSRVQRRLFEYVPQSVRLHLNPMLTVEFLLSRRLGQSGLDVELNREAAALLGAVGLPESYLSKTTAELSGGECQRLGIALALASAPRVLLLDEVTASLDATNAAMVKHMLSAIRASRSMTMVLVSHQPDLLKGLADAVLVVEGGRVKDRVAADDPRRGAVLESWGSEHEDVDGDGL